MGSLALIITSAAAQRWIVSPHMSKVIKFLLGTALSQIHDVVSNTFPEVHLCCLNNSLVYVADSSNFCELLELISLFMKSVLWSFMVINDSLSRKTSILPSSLRFYAISLSAEII